MKTFTEQEIQAVKSASGERFDGRVLRVDLDEPMDTTVLVAPFDRAGYAAYYDAKCRDPQTAYHGVLLKRLLWPSFQEVEKIRQSWAMFSEQVATELELEAGTGSLDAIIQPLDTAKPPTGLSSEDAAALIKSSARKLWSVDAVELGLSCVMETPSTEVWLAARSLDGDARTAHRGIVAATEAYVFDAIKWSSHPIRGGSGLLDERPGGYWDLWVAYKMMGGAGVSVRRKSL